MGNVKGNYERVGKGQLHQRNFALKATLESKARFLEKMSSIRALINTPDCVSQYQAVKRALLKQASKLFAYLP